MRTWKYHSICPRKTTLLHKPTDLEELLEALRVYEDKHLGESFLPAGYTYLGQLIDHDLSFLRDTDEEPNVTKHLKLEQLWQARRPALDLDTIYGAGLDDSMARYDHSNGTFVMGETITKSKSRGMLRDLPRSPNGTPMIADSRNDQHLLISQMQVLWMNLHNKVVDHYISQGFYGADKLFSMARKEVIHIYQHVVVHDFCRRILPYEVYQAVLVEGQGRLSQASKQSPTIALEFAAAAFRLHSMVRTSYFLNTNKGTTNSAGLEKMFRLTGRNTKERYILDEADLVDWYLFFDGPLAQIKQEFNFANVLSTRIPAFDIDLNGKPTTMRIRTPERSSQISLATGQELCSHLKNIPEFAGLVDRIELKGANFGGIGLKKSNYYRTRTPLWIYLMHEAGKEANPNALGPIGGWIVADTIQTAILSCAEGLSPDWRPRNSVLYKPVLSKKSCGQERITMYDVVKFTYGDEPI